MQVDSSPHERLVRQIGHLSFEQLSSLRHRGAITTVAGTFSACCKASSISAKREPTVLLNTWYNETIGSIHGKATVLTRRSAGIPFLLVAIVLAEIDGPIYQMAFSDLLDEAQLRSPRSRDGDDTRLPQVHALNCLKDLFMCSSIPSNSYITTALEVAASSISSPM